MKELVIIVSLVNFKLIFSFFFSLKINVLYLQKSQRRDWILTPRYSCWVDVNLFLIDFNSFFFLSYTSLSVVGIHLFFKH